MSKAKGNKKLASLPLLVLVLSLVFSGTGVFSALYAAFTIATQSFVSQTYSYSWEDAEKVTHQESVRFDCYPISNGYSGSHPGIAVAWHDETGAARNTPDHLDVPTTLSDKEGNVYNVVAVAKGGFRRCDFQTVSLHKDIQEIGEEGFAYCESLTKFVLPYSCKVISPSMLLDCRNLETFHYQTSGGAETTASDQVTTVGDHAFMKCVKLRGFSCPSTLTYIGDSAFQNCKSITTIFFPSTTETVPGDVPEEKRISIGKYAFADCDILTMVYFDVNVASVGQYAFAHCNLQKLSLNYTGTASTFEAIAGVDAHWRDQYTAIEQTAKYKFTDKRGKLDYDRTDNYPGLYFSIENDIGDLTLDQSTMTNYQAKIFRVLGNTEGGTTDKDIDKNEVPTDFLDSSGQVERKYATILEFQTPSPSDFVDVDDPYYSDGVLKIPDAVTANDGHVYPVRVIDVNAFKDHGELTEVHFGQYLVQIRHWSFLGCDNIAVLDFDDCDDLLEVSYEVFHSKDTKTLSVYNTENSALTELVLPEHLKYIGASAFYNFTMVDTFTMTPKAVFFGQSAFENLGRDITGPGMVEITLPNTMRDGPVDDAADLSKGGTRGFKIWRYTANNYWDECIQKDAFRNAKCLRSVTMAPTSSAIMTRIANNPNTASESPKGHNNLKPYRNGIQVGAFAGCSSLVRFEANKQLYVIGRGAFCGCTSLKEMFLTTLSCRNIQNNGTDPCPWGFNGQTLGDGAQSGKEASIFEPDTNEDKALYADCVFPDLVIYIDHASGAPHGNGKIVRSSKWNRIAKTYPNTLASTSTPLAATHAGAARSDVYYYDLTSAEATTPYLDKDHVNLSSSCVAFIKKSGNYTITRCYPGSSGVAKVDMSKFADASSIKTIGPGAFAQTADGHLPGRHIVLPSSLTTIADRAFYRGTTEQNNSRGMNIVTYKDGTEQTIAGKTNYCVLPPSVTSVGRLAFYNNCFESVSIKGNLSYLGNTAFAVFPFEKTDTESAASRNSVDSVSLGATQSKFGVSATNGGLYYTGESGARKTLIYQPASFSDGSDSTDDDELRVDSGTLAIGARACANTKYTSVSIPDSLTTIYGGAFNRCLNLGTVSFGSTPGLKYISAKAYDEDDVWTGDTANAASTMSELPNSSEISFDDYHGAFYKSGITTLDFTKLTSLVKIGYGAFEECQSLTNLTGTAKYTYYKWPLVDEALQPYNNTSTEKTSQVLDLSGCLGLRAIGYKAFRNCKSLKFAHLPANTNSLYLGSGESESGRSINQGSDESVFNGCSGLRVLVGEKSATANINNPGTGTANAARYPQKTFDGSNRIAYFAATSSSDLISAEATRYWYELPPKNGVRRFVLMDNKSQADDFFGANFNTNKLL